MGALRQEDTWLNPLVHRACNDSSYDVVSESIHGRVYDPTLARFLSPDPFVQAPTNTQSLNRYTYVNNNPMAYTDPSGYIFKKLFKSISKGWKKIGQFVKKHWKTILVVGLAVAGGVWMTGIMKGITSSKVLIGMAVGATSSAIAGFTGTVVNGGNLRQALRAGLKGAAEGAVSGAIGGYIGAKLGNFGKLGGVGADKFKLGKFALNVGAHTIAQGAISKLKGQGFDQGARSAFYSTLLKPVNNAIFTEATQDVHRALLSGAIGGTASHLAGGDFTQGAMSAVVVSLVNQNLSQPEPGYLNTRESCWGSCTVVTKKNGTKMWVPSSVAANVIAADQASATSLAEYETTTKEQALGAVGKVAAAGGVLAFGYAAVGFTAGAAVLGHAGFAAGVGSFYFDRSPANGASLIMGVSGKALASIPMPSSNISAGQFVDNVNTSFGALCNSVMNCNHEYGK